MLITNTRLARLYVLKNALKVEMLGMKRRGRSVYSIIKEEFGLKGNRQKVYDTFSVMIQSMNDEQQGEA